MKIIKKKNFLTSVLLLTLFAFLAGVVFVEAAVWDPANTNLPTNTIQQIIVNAINWLTGIVATVSVIVILIGGVYWITAGGDEERVKSSRRWMVGGIGGLIIALAAWAIVKVVTEKFF
ncbi:MAG: hypothetical protein A3I88_00115 [Candidatus Portnoybacteria bacterium RIFCSPLOWO2_12_FULL_39_9]|uniref:Uncharacterized protein n=1 Tax=Candidatus Portnoybacteria bacterium RIFCSPHIGHO2_12_FULL_38_9 TaxID=1801997 RepID=A0A1G2FHV1_9BACT|nr:MAG: hypothetical protein A3H00_03310 [Candidatus Portnoybacteria bacterium RBG_13_40_8]OGZ37012.1 MAG: hypothetical protein A2646_00765 [Candidatus Portnoybacteria bacterium RIFCSPHIGHO2_02_FULL_39_12]OGZ37643.1 MAG: hypothetical protein A3J64_00075 [Candidatus Portnoybacteria bacterium RIFCSPHIGHO2_12_FULL_38_9]OGZ39307.1 MAG: hypothetical protein A3F21_02430 [Candidatus Portnoybacteria bacterium RIFCSPLOWO2_01_FULL_38_39]OGZ39656.1 MAG: hypothetical protein A3I88_00115 [Candidatus Portnoy